MHAAHWVRSVLAAVVIGVCAGGLAAADATREVRKESLLERCLADEAIHLGRLRAEVTAVLREARRLRRSDPVRAVDVLKAALRRLEVDSLHDHKVVGALRRRVAIALRESVRAKERHDLETIDRQRRQASEAETRRRATLAEQNRLRVRQLLDRAYTLINQGRYAEAAGQAARAREVDRSSVEVMWTQALTRRFQKLGRARSYEEARRENTHRVARESLESSTPMTYGVIWFPDPEKWARLTRERRRYAVVDVSQRGPREEAILAALKRPVSFDFAGVTLADALDFLREFSGVNIVLDTPALQEEGVSPDTPLNLKLTGVSLKSALNLLLGQMNLTHLVQNEVLLVTSQARAQSTVVTRVYPVADLVVPIRNADDVEIGGEGFGVGATAGGLPGGAAGTVSGGGVGRGASQRDSRDLLEELAELIEYVVGRSL